MRKIHKSLKVGSLHQSNECGKFKVIEFNGCNSVLIEFVETGYRKFVRYEHVRNGTIRDKLYPSLYGVGCIGDGPHKTRRNGVVTDCHQVWRSMMARCYSDSYSVQRPTYSGCAVDKAWHNFQNFADWYYLNHPLDEKKYHLDKDIKVEGNRVYGPETCMFVTQKENQEKASAKWYKFNSPSGDIVDIYNLSDFCKEKGLSVAMMCGVSKGKIGSHKGWKKGA